MSDVIGRGVIEVSADSRKLTAGIDEAKRSLKSLGIAAGDATKGQSASIDKYVKSLGVAAVTTGKTARELELYKLALRGASAEQLKAADSALKMTEAYAKGEKIGQQIKTGLLTIGTVAATGLIAAYVAFDQLVKKAGDFQDMAEKTGDTAQNIASLAVAAGTAGTSMETIVSASAKLTKGLTGVDDESKAAGSAIAALGLNIKDFKDLAPADQMESVGKALNSFKDGAQKTAVAMALFGKSGADLLPFLKEIGAEGGRQVILTQEQITQADAYADKQAKLRTELGLHAQAIATQMLPAYNLFNEALIDTAKEMLGVQDGINGMTKGDQIKDFANSGALLLANIADIAYDVGGAFRFVGDNLGAMVAIAAANARLDFAGAIAIGKASDEQNIKTLQGLGLADKVQKKIDAMNNTSQKAKFVDPRILGSVGTIAEQDAANKKVLKFDGAVPKEKGSIGAEAKAQLALDISNIKTASNSLIGAYSDAEKIMQAMRSADLVNDKDYYASKLGFLNLNTQAQEDALSKEIARLQQEKLTGKDKLDNQKAIVEAQAKLAKVRADSVSGVTINAIQEEAANKKIAQSYTDSTIAAQAYIDTVNRQNAREIAGIGKGDKFRAEQAGISAIEDRQTNKRQELDSDLRNKRITKESFDQELAIVNDTYAKEVDAFLKKNKDIEAGQANWLNGATKAFANYHDSIADVAKSTEELFTNSMKGMENALVDFVKTGKLDFASLADSIISDMIRMTVQQSITKPLAAMGSSFISSFAANADGGVYNSPSLSAYSGKVVSSPTMFAFANGAGLMGEAGPEAIMPLSRGANGKLGVQSSGGGMIVNIIESPGNGGQQNRRTENGVDVLDIMVEKIKSSIAGDISKGSGSVPAALGRTYGLNRTVGAY